MKTKDLKNIDFSNSPRNDEDVNDEKKNNFVPLASNQKIWT